MSFKRYGGVKTSSTDLQKDLYYLLLMIKELNKNSEDSVRFELDDIGANGKWEVTFKRV